MKAKIITSIAFVLVTFHLSFGQYNLQFKSVKTWSLSGQGQTQWGVTLASQTVTVDPGTVLKIESAGVSNYYNNTWFYPNVSSGIALENTILMGYTSTNAKVETNFPVWLPAGTYTLKLFDFSGSGLSSTYYVKGFVTAIEFILVTP
jgi:hypothetical protein